jgi:penicillin-binding protein 1A
MSDKFDSDKPETPENSASPEGQESLKGDEKKLDDASSVGAPSSVGELSEQDDELFVDDVPEDKTLKALMEDAPESQDQGSEQDDAETDGRDAEQVSEKPLRAEGAESPSGKNSDEKVESGMEPITAPRKEKKERKKRRGGFWLWFKIFAGLGAVGLVVALGAVGWLALHMMKLSEDLPPYEQLAEYEPPVTTRVHAGDGTLVAEFARERRLFVPITDIPDAVKYAFLSAEDKGFYEHGGLDYRGILRAQINNISNYLNNRSLEGGSTITQQVAKNFLLTSEQKLDRKLKEMMIARRMERAFTKDQILELYLNEIYLGNRSYGVAAAALNYFDKSLEEITIDEAAYLATLAKAPSNYHPLRNTDRALARRNWIIGRMLEDGHISEEEALAATEMPLGAVIAPPLGARSSDTEYFAEKVRKEIAEVYGVEKLYDGGLSIRSTLDPNMQEAAQHALRDGLNNYDRRHGWRGALAKVILPDLNAIDEEASHEDKQIFAWQSLLIDQSATLMAVRAYAKDMAPWEPAMVLSVSAKSATLGFADGAKGKLGLEDALWARAYIDPNTIGPEVTSLKDVLQPGDIVLAEPKVIAEEAQPVVEGEEAPKPQPRKIEKVLLQQMPAVNGGLIALDPHTGRVLAMVGGFSFGVSEYNRAIQARRQPGSTFKPFVYAAALDSGYTPSTIVLDAPFVAPSLGNEWWTPGNYIEGRFYGESTLRLGIEKSRNTMTARLAQDIGIGIIIEYAEKFGVSKQLPRELAISLGAGETTLIDLTTAYAMFVNGGKRIEPVFIDRVQDRYGETILKRDMRPCIECDAEDWHGQSEPFIPDQREQVIDPRTAYQMVSILEGVIQRGTGTRVKPFLNKPVAGKTGTTNDYKDAWFVGFSPDLAVGIYVGFDQPATMGQGEGGGIVAAPIFGEFMAAAIGDEPGMPFRIPSGIRLVRVNSVTGRPATAGEGNIILEAFKVEDDIYGSSRFSIRGGTLAEGVIDEGIDDDLGGLY